MERMTEEPRDEDEFTELEASRRAQLDDAAAMTPAERFAAMDRLCREITWFAAHAERVG
jgi:hypothetical protein